MNPGQQPAATIIEFLPFMRHGFRLSTVFLLDDRGVAEES